MKFSTTRQTVDRLLPSVGRLNLWTRIHRFVYFAFLCFILFLISHSFSLLPFRLVMGERWMSEEYSPGTFFVPPAVICIPCPEGADFELKPSVMSLVTQTQFGGEPGENPFYHIEGFEWLVDSLKKKGTPKDWVNGLLFPHSLKGKASDWLDNQDPGAFTTWEEVRGAFLNHFYTKEMTDLKRSEMHGFKQGDHETFQEAWFRYKELFRSCPHHEFPQDRLVMSFYKGLTWDYKSVLDAINGGDFREQYPDEAFTMIGKFARSSSAKYRKKVSLTPGDSKLLLDIKHMLEEMMRREEVATSQSSETISFKTMARRLYGGCYAIRHKHKVKIPKKRSQRMRDARLFKACSDLGDKVEEFVMEMSMSIDVLNDRFFHLQERIKIIEEKLNIEKDEVVELHEPSPSEEDQHDYKQEKSIEMEDLQKDCCMARTKIVTWAKLKPSKQIQTTEEDEELEAVVHEPKEAPKDEVRPDFYKENLLGLLAVRRAREVRVDRQLTPVGRQNLTDEPIFAFTNTKKRRSNPRENRLKRTLEQLKLEDFFLTTLPFFKCEDFEERKPNLNELQSEAEFDEHLDQATRELIELYPFIKPLDMEAKFKVFIQDMFTQRRSVHYALIIFAQLCDEKMLLKAEFKKPDPGIFTIECYIGKTYFKKAMCDLGSSISLIPQNLAQALGFEKYMEENDIMVYLADRSRCEPEGKITNVPVQIGSHFIPTDFYIIRYTIEREYPILFGRPFLAAAGAVIDTKEKKIVLNFETESVELQMDQPGILFTSEKRVHHINELRSEGKQPTKKQKLIYPPNSHPEDETT